MFVSPRWLWSKCWMLFSLVRRHNNCSSRTTFLVFPLKQNLFVNKFFVVIFVERAVRWLSFLTTQQVLSCFCSLNVSEAIFQRSIITTHLHVRRLFRTFLLGRKRIIDRSPLFKMVRTRLERWKITAITHLLSSTLGAFTEKITLPTALNWTPDNGEQNSITRPQWGSASQCVVWSVSNVLAANKCANNNSNCEEPINHRQPFGEWCGLFFCSLLFFWLQRQREQVWRWAVSPLFDCLCYSFQ